eukprot:CAMPEP_0178410644 /NCGR_PEP_ID=MMETSP0689_2-20121128/21089_1 /TAXON_ID=160604 /ORGANISM="Amphidinium massartii, Strain CS-259" /LENGTH=264 /DNA_ID=CAMNT_0020031833 /DNA_START=90 /DNA_END=884 /DNA_ORIENTATION=-
MALAKLFGGGGGAMGFTSLRAAATANVNVRVADTPGAIQVANTPGAVRVADTPGAIQAANVEDAITAFKNVHFLFDVNKAIPQMAMYGSAAAVLCTAVMKNMDHWQLQWPSGQESPVLIIMGVFLAFSIASFHLRIANLESAIQQADQDLKAVLPQHSCLMYDSGWQPSPQSNGQEVVLRHGLRDITQVSQISMLLSVDGGNAVYSICGVTSSGTGQYGCDVVLTTDAITVKCRHVHGGPVLISEGTKIATHFRLVMHGCVPVA